MPSNGKQHYVLEVKRAYVYVYVTEQKKGQLNNSQANIKYVGIQEKDEIINKPT